MIFDGSMANSLCHRSLFSCKDNTNINTLNVRNQIKNQIDYWSMAIPGKKAVPVARTTFLRIAGPVTADSRQ